MVAAQVDEVGYVHAGIERVLLEEQYVCELFRCLLHILARSFLIVKV